MEYEGKGGRNHDDFTDDKQKKVYNKTFYLVCVPCNYNGNKNEIICAECGEKMHQKSTMGRIDARGHHKF